MLFNSLGFLVFFPAFCIVYFLCRERSRLWTILLASYIFYSWWDVRLLPVLLAMTAANYYIGRQIPEVRVDGTRRWLLAGGICLNLAVLFTFKYLGLLTGAALALARAAGFDAPPLVLRIILPVGISFYIFEMISYLVEIYRQHLEPSQDLLKFAIFVAFFPRLVAGPILRPQQFLPQLENLRNPSSLAVMEGLEMALWGLFKKVAIADQLAAFVDPVLGNPFASSANTLRVATIFYSFQIYCDFSGYSGIAIGIGKMLGFDLGRNFDKPYFSTSFSEFWTRWHISLSSWLRDYLYIPLGGSRGSKNATWRNLLLTMLLGGLWHGANWTFMAWGGLHGLFLVLQRLLAGPLDRMAEALRVPGKARSLAAGILVFTLVTLAWIPFRARDFASAWHVFSAVTGTARWSLYDVPNKFQVLRNFALIGVMSLLEYCDLRIRFPQIFAARPILRPLAGAAVLLAISLFGVFGSHAFIYFQF